MKIQFSSSWGWYLLLVPVVIILVVGVNNEWSVNAKLEKVEIDWNIITKAIQDYSIDHWDRPPDTVLHRKSNPAFPLTFETDMSFAKRQEVSAISNLKPTGDTLTSPVGYLSKLPLDPFNPGHYYGYTVWLDCDDIIILHSPGPDRKDDLPLEELRNILDPCFQKRGWGGLTGSDTSVIRNLIFPHMYDPTNGIHSRGDLFRWSTLLGVGNKYPPSMLEYKPTEDTTLQQKVIMSNTSTKN